MQKPAACLPTCLPLGLLRSDVGKLLTQHPLVSAIHLTGSHHTYNAIVWGSSSAEVSGLEWGGGGTARARLPCLVPVAKTRSTATTTSALQ